MEWLLEYLQEHLDLWQYGGQKGSSVSHYLIDFINFVSYNQDINNIHAVLAVAVDFSKAFNRQNHNILIELLSELGIPGWLLQIVIGFLENRQIEVHYKGEKSNRRGPSRDYFGYVPMLDTDQCSWLQGEDKEHRKNHHSTWCEQEEANGHHPQEIH